MIIELFPLHLQPTQLAVQVKEKEKKERKKVAEVSSRTLDLGPSCPRHCSP